MKTEEPPQHPGIILKEKFLDPLGITARALADSLSVTHRRVTELLKGRRSLTPDMAHRLALFFDVPSLWFLEMQARFEAHRREPKPDEYLVKPLGRGRGYLITPGGVHFFDRSRFKPPAPLMVRVSDELRRRLEAQVALAPPRPPRKPKVVVLPDGTPILTGE